MMDRRELDRWMAAAAEGDRRAITPLFQALWPLVVRYAHRLLGDAQLAEDCAQDTLIQLFGQVDRYDPARDALTWALTLATWQCRTARRRRGRRGAPEAPLGEDHAGASRDGASAVERRDLVRAAVATLETLSPRDIETITLAVTDAPAEDVAPATFRKRLERALARLRTSWRSRHEAS